MNRGIAVSELEILDNEKFRPITEEDCPNVGLTLPRSNIPYQCFQIIGEGCYIKCPLTQTFSCCGNKYPKDCQDEPNLLPEKRICNLEKQTLRYNKLIFNYVDIFGGRKD